MLSTKQLLSLKDFDISSLQSYINEINRIKNLDISKLNPTKKDVWETQQLKLYAKALTDVDDKQAALLLSTQGLSNAQIQQVLNYLSQPHNTLSMLCN